MQYHMVVDHVVFYIIHSQVLYHGISLVIQAIGLGSLSLIIVMVNPLHRHHDHYLDSLFMEASECTGVNLRFNSSPPSAILYASLNEVSIGSDNGLWPVWHQAIVKQM